MVHDDFERPSAGAGPAIRRKTAYAAISRPVMRWFPCTSSRLIHKPTGSHKIANPRPECPGHPRTRPAQADRSRIPRHHAATTALPQRPVRRAVGVIRPTLECAGGVSGLGGGSCCCRPQGPPGSLRYAQRMPIADSCSARSGGSVAALLPWFPIHAPRRSSRSSWSSPTIRSMCLRGTRRCPSRS